jgi:hypothetical protein
MEEANVTLRKIKSTKYSPLFEDPSDKQKNINRQTWKDVIAES